MTRAISRIKTKFVLWLIGSDKKHFIGKLGGFTEEAFENKKNAWDLCIAELQKNDAVTLLGPETYINGSQIYGSLVVAPGSYHITINQCYFSPKTSPIPDPTLPEEFSEGGDT